MDEGLKTLLDLTNPKFTFKFADKEYLVKRATLQQVSLYQAKVSELLKETEKSNSSKDIQIITYCIYLILKEVDENITEDFVQANIPGNIIPLELLEQLGFMNPAQAKLMKEIQTQLPKTSQQDTLEPLPELPTE